LSIHEEYEQIYHKFQKQVLHDPTIMLGGSHVTKAWHVLMLQMEGRPSDMEGSCDYIE